MFSENLIDRSSKEKTVGAEEMQHPDKNGKYCYFLKIRDVIELVFSPNAHLKKFRNILDKRVLSFQKLSMHKVFFF